MVSGQPPFLPLEVLLHDTRTWAKEHEPDSGLTVVKLDMRCTKNLHVHVTGAPQTGETLFEAKWCTSCEPVKTVIGETHTYHISGAAEGGFGLCWR